MYIHVCSMYIHVCLTMYANIAQMKEYRGKFKLYIYTYGVVIIVIQLC